jgi:ferredoxin--NADP+ reductase/benzoate/toluate 1,2-dioxygenase reductase subunit
VKTEPAHSAALFHPEARVVQVLQVRDLSSGAFVLRLERDGLQFRPGQYVKLGMAGSIHRREYTIYSTPGQDYLEVLVKEVATGLVSRQLRGCRPGDRLAVDGPFGSFTIEEQDLGRPFLFVATGTGVSPFHCFVGSYPELRYHLLHGVRQASELYDRQDFDPRRFLACVSREPGGDFHGRVTQYLRQHLVNPETLCYLCGNSDMIYETFGILRGYGVPSGHIFTEVYF